MSGGGNKKKLARSQGWEEAGSEFYQERYPTDAEFDARHLATLLPSKQTRAATIRIRTTDNRTMRRQTLSRAGTAHRRTSTAVDVQDSMLPDMSQVQSDEQTVWEKIMEIKAMPVAMAEKRERRNKIKTEPNLLLQGYEQFKWKRRKIWRQFASRTKELYSKLELWKHALKRIEGQFGTGVVAYFLFLKYLLFLNLAIFSLIFLFVVLPAILLVDLSDYPTPDTNTTNVVLDFVQGTGFMEHSLLFYGYYPNETLAYGSGAWYNLPLAYVAVTLVYLLTSLMTIVKAAADGFKERLMEGEGQFYRYCNVVFGGWDFCVRNEKSANIKHMAIFNEIRGCVEADRMRERKSRRTRPEKVKLYVTRTAVNAVVLGVLVAGAYAIFYTFKFSTEQTDYSYSYFESLFYEFLPSLVIVALNVLIPFIFRLLVRLENYTPIFVVRITLVRTVLLRLASIFTLYASLYDSLVDHPCWETFVGQQVYKLVLTDFASHVLLTFVVNFPRALLARHVNSNFAKVIGEQSFDLSKHVLDVVYSQTLCWLGCFYAPLLSFVFVVLFVVMFHVKKFSCLVNSVPSATIYRASRSNSMFMVVLLISFVSVVVPMAFAFSEIKPSETCGPFRLLPSVWYQVEVEFFATPVWFQDVLAFLTTAGFALPVFLVLVLSVCYFRAVSSANRHMVVVLKNQLVLEGHDKQFLLRRLSDFVKQQQEHQKRRRFDVVQDGATNISN